MTSIRIIEFFILFTSIFFKQSYQKHPKYSYVCKEDGSVEFTGFKQGSHVKIVSTVQGANCSKQDLPIVSSRDNVVSITVDCMGNDLKVNRSVTVRVQDKHLGETKSIPTSGNILGGLSYHEFVLECSKISEIERNVLRQFHLIDTETIFSKENEVGQIDMRFKAEDDITLPDISEVYIGDKFYIFLQYKGVSEYMIEPQECVAYKGNDKEASANESRHETLWEKVDDTSNHCVFADAKNKGLIGAEGFLFKDEKTVHASLYGFRFRGSEDITITCRVLLKQLLVPTPIPKQNVCPTTTTTTTTAAPAATTSTASTTVETSEKTPPTNGTAIFGKRRRRSLNTKDKSQTVLMTLTVKDKLKDNSSRGCIFVPCTSIEVITFVAGVLLMGSF